MGPEIEIKGTSEIVMGVSGNKETASVVKEPEDKHMRCASNYEDNAFEVEPLMDEETEGAERSRESRGLEVNILENTNSGDIGLVEAESRCPSDNSSSFDNTISGFENGSTLSDAEVESELNGNASSALSFDGYSEIFRIRKKRLTPHWRTYIRPLMWRCKWLELQIKKLQSQAIKYDRELADYKQRKQLALENCILEGFCAKSLPFCGQSKRKEVMKRKKRKRVENTVDIASYMSHHNLFSYYEIKRSTADGAFMGDDWGDQVNCAEKINGSNDIEVNDELLSLEFRGGDESLEYILSKIGVVQSQLSKMKTRLHKIMSENAGKFSSTDKLSLIASCNGLTTSSAQNPTSPHNNGDRMPEGSSYMATQGDLFMPESAASSHGEVTHVPDTIEGTDQHEVIRGSSKNNRDGILIYSRRGKDYLKNFKELNIEPVEKPQLPKEEQENSNPPFHVLEPDLPTNGQPTPKIRSISKLTATKNKRKRGRRKAGSSRWIRRSLV
ncbi:hypothetical protein U1Q18_036007 [Sarracenia purpurea var. burkii]